MAYVWCRTFKPAPGWEEPSLTLLRQLDAAAARMPGFIGGVVFSRRPEGGLGYIGSLTVWETEATAARAAQDGRLRAIYERLVELAPELVVERLADVQAGLGLPLERHMPVAAGRIAAA